MYIYIYIYIYIYLNLILGSVACGPSTIKAKPSVKCSFTSG